MDNTDGVRLDRWLWSARFFKTRQMAADAVRSATGTIATRAVFVAENTRVPFADWTVIRHDSLAKYRLYKCSHFG